MSGAIATQACSNDLMWADRCWIQTKQVHDMVNSSCFRFNRKAHMPFSTDAHLYLICIFASNNMMPYYIYT